MPARRTREEIRAAAKIRKEQRLAAARARAIEREMSRRAVRIRGLSDVIEKLDFSKSAISVLKKYLKSAGTVVAGEARRRAPVDSGLLRTSISTEVFEKDGVVVAAIGTNVANNGKPYGAYMEFGTGLVHDHPSWPRARHVVPPAALMGWAERKGRGGGNFNEYSVANSITRRGGLKPRRYLRGALGVYEVKIGLDLSHIGTEIRRANGL
jgi:hypothetical protein